MPQATPTSTSLSARTGARDPFLLDAEQLRDLASTRIVRRGIGYFKEQRVIELEWSDDHLWGVVEGSDPDHPYSVEIERDPDGGLLIDCSCPFDWEPACKHAIAALLAYGERQEVEHTTLESAAEEAIAERKRSGRSQVVVKHVDGDPWFGEWSAVSVSGSSHGHRPYRVEIRSLGKRMNLCTCPDFAYNRLGTCKHIEAVLHKLKKRGPQKYERLAAQGPSIAIVSLAWDVPEAPLLRVHRPASIARGLRTLLDRYFGADGFFRGSPTDGFQRFREEAVVRDDLLVGEDAIGHVRRLREHQVHAARAVVIRDEIRRSGGHLPGIRARLYPYQVEGVAFLASTGRALLADDMGLGKTLQAIAASVWLLRNEDLRRALIVCPASLKHQWAREIRRFTGLDVVVIEGRVDERGYLYRQRAPFTVVNYELVLRDLTVIGEELAADLLVLDEAQRIKNWRTKTAAAIKDIRTRYAFVLTGTPLENRLEDLYSLMQVVDQRALGPLWRYMLEFHVTDRRGKVLGYRNLTELRRRLRPVMLRRDRRLVRDQLPDRIEQRLDVALTTKQREIHDDALAAAGKLARILKRRPLTPSEERRLLAALQNARMACDAAGLVDKETEGSPKLDELSRLLEELCLDGGQKAVVFSQWERMIKMAEQVARRVGLGSVRLHGGVPSAKRSELIDRFNEDAATQVFLSTDAGGVGLNLQAASVLINLDLPWNPAVLDQRIARVHRLGQKETVQVLLLAAAESYEQRVAALLETKRSLFVNVVEPEAAEDVVGLHKRMVDLVLETLPEAEPEPDPGAAAPSEAQLLAPEPEAEEAPRPEAEEAPRPEAAAPVPQSLAPTIETLQRELGARVERILVSGGGLLVVSDGVDDATEALARRASAEVPVAIVSRETFGALARLGLSPQLEGAAVAYDRSQASELVDETPPLVRLARRKLRAAETLLRERESQEAMALLATSMLAAITERAGNAELPDAAGAAVWLFGDLVPGGIIDAEEATAYLRTRSLAEAAEVPDHLAEQALLDARRFVSVP